MEDLDAAGLVLLLALLPAGFSIAAVAVAQYITIDLFTTMASWMCRKAGMMNLRQASDIAMLFHSIIARFLP